jgi:hypothetical protein
LQGRIPWHLHATRRSSVRDTGIHHQTTPHRTKMQPYHRPPMATSMGRPVNGLTT